MNYADLISGYCAGPQMLRAALAGMTAEQLDARPIPGKWSTKQVICHIADFEPVYVDRMKRVIAEHEPTLLSGDPDLFAAQLAYDQRGVAVELDFIEAKFFVGHGEPLEAGRGGDWLERVGGV
jgi:hypothetical protein